VRQRLTDHTYQEKNEENLLTMLAPSQCETVKGVVGRRRHDFVEGIIAVAQAVFPPPSFFVAL
jgi:hypothetical protein